VSRNGRGGAASPTIRPGRIRDLQKGVHVNRSQLVAEAAKRTGLEEKAVDAALRGILEVVAGVVAKGKDKVTIPGWVGFEQVARAARKARNPQTGEVIKVAKSKGVKVTAGATLKNIAAGKVPAPAAAKPAKAAAKSTKAPAKAPARSAGAKAVPATRTRTKTAAASAPRKAASKASSTRPAASRTSRAAAAKATPAAKTAAAKAAPAPRGGKAKSAAKAKAGKKGK
jgi:DNA-binding protein HU-beta